MSEMSIPAARGHKAETRTLSGGDPEFHDIAIERRVVAVTVVRAIDFGDGSTSKNGCGQIVVSDMTSTEGCPDGNVYVQLPPPPLSV